MSLVLSPLEFGGSFLDANGNPRVGAQLFVYLAGTQTKASLYADSAGSASLPNPVILNSSGQVANVAGTVKPLWWSAGSLYDLSLAPPTDTDPPTSPIWTLEDIIGLNDVSRTVDQWVAGPTPTYISGTQFSLVGDQTSTFHVGRRVKATISGGTVYGTITASAYTTLTTVTVVWDADSLDSGLSAVYYGLLTAENPAVPGVKISGLNYTFLGNVVAQDITAEADLTAGGDTDVQGLSVHKELVIDGEITPSQLTANADDYNPTGLATASILRLSTDASRNLTGLTAQAGGTTLVLLNVGTNDLVIVSESSSSTEANRFSLVADRTISGKQAVTIRYDATLARWVIVGDALLKTFGAVSDVTGSRSISTVYQNTTLKPIHVAVSGNGGGTITGGSLLIDTANPPTNVVSEQQGGTGVTLTVTGIVPPGYYYKAVVDGGHAFGLSKWVETT